MNKLKSAWSLVKNAAWASSQDKVPMMGAALAYYTAFSIAPILVISIGVVGIVFGDSGGAGVFETISGLIGENGASAVQSMVEGAASRPRAGVVATVLGVLTLLVGASGVFGQLQEALNVIWKVALKPTAGWGVTLRRRLLSFGMVGVIAFLLLTSLVVSAGLSAAGKLFTQALPGGEALWQAVNAIVSLGVIAALFAMIFKVLPDVRLPWRVAWIGGIWTSLLFSVGKLAIGLYLGKSGVASTYGAAGSVIVLLLWVYYSSQILLFGAELTRAYAERSGHRVPPKPAATQTLTAFNAAAMAEKAVKDSRPNAGAGWYVLGAAGLLGGARLVKEGSGEGWARPWRTAVLGGFSAGAGLVLLSLLEARRRSQTDGDDGEAEGKPSFARRVAASIPFSKG
jgi:membrane protein